jgi:hypothetical protein
MACFWFLQARFEGFSPSTWVYVENMVDRPWYEQYIMSLYWAFQTLTTVGYGDFGANNMNEFYMNILWMLCGVIFYAIIVASITSLIATEDNTSEGSLNGYLKLLESFAKEHNLNDDMNNKIRQYLLNNRKTLFSQKDEDDLLKELPCSLREEILYHQYGQLVE